MKGAFEVDYAIAIATIIFVIAITVAYVSNYFTPSVSASRSAGLKAVLDSTREAVFDSYGFPANWEEFNRTPLRAGLKIDLVKIPVNIKETYLKTRVNEPIDAHVFFDNDCKLTAWNDTIRVYDSLLNESAVQIYNETFCSPQFLREGNVVFLANQSASGEKIFFAYGSNKTSVAARNYPLLLHQYDYFDGSSISSKWNNYEAAIQSGSAVLYWNSFLNSSESFKYKTVEIFSNISNRTVGFSGVGSSGDETSKCAFQTDGSAAPILYCNTSSTAGITATNCGTIDERNYTWRIEWNSSHCSYFKNDTLITATSTNIPSAFMNVTIKSVGYRIVVDYAKVWENNTKLNSTYPLSKSAVSAPSSSAVSYFKLNSSQYLSYDDLRASLGLTNHFNATFCGYTLGRPLPERTNVITYSVPTIFYNYTGLLKSCLATLSLW